jgi:hypothetical protein
MDLADIVGHGAPAAARPRGHLPAAVGQCEHQLLGIAVEQLRRAEERGAGRAHAVRAAQGHFDRQRLVAQTAVAPQALDIDHRRDQAPEAGIVRAVVQIDRQARHQPDTALPQCERPGQHQLARPARALRRLGLLRHLAVVEADGLLVARQRIHQADHHVRRGADVAQLRPPLEQRPRRALEARLVDARVGGDHTHQTAHQQDVAAQIALQAALQQQQAFAHLGMLLGAMRGRVLAFDEIGRQQQADDGECQQQQDQPAATIRRAAGIGRHGASVLRLQMQMRGPRQGAARTVAMVVHAVGHLDRDDVELAVAHAALGRHGVGEGAHRAGGPLEDHAFEAVVVVEMGVHGRHGQIVMAMLQDGEPLGEIALVVVVDVGQVGDAMAAAPGGGFLLARRLQVFAQQVAHRLRAVAVAALLDQGVELLRQRLVERDGDAFHIPSSCPDYFMCFPRYRQD